MAKRILYVFGGLGPPTPYVLPRVKRHGDVYIYLAGKPNDYTARVLRDNATAFVNELSDEPEQLGDDELRRRVVDAARSVNADAVVTFDEFRLEPVAQATAELGLRGPGPDVHLSRNKWRMREAFHAAGVPSPRYAFVDGVESLQRACDELSMPIVLKTTGGAASLGHGKASSFEEALERWESARRVVRSYGQENRFHAIGEFENPVFIAEEVIKGSTESWYPEGTPYGDYLSVEGLVCDGEYFPIGITSRLPTIYPFTEIGNQTPCVLAHEMQMQIADVARRAVLALRPQCCGTHTEIKLMRDRELCVIETAARLPGVTNVPQLERVYGFDMVDALMRILLEGSREGLPAQMFTGPGLRAAGNLGLLPVDAGGRPWSDPPRFRSNVDWRALVSPETTVEVEWSKTIGEGSWIAPYDEYKGAMNSFGLVYLESPRVETLVRDQLNIVANLRSALDAANREEFVTSA